MMNFLYRYYLSLQEERESLFGQVFCFAALIQALDHKKVEHYYDEILFGKNDLVRTSCYNVTSRTSDIIF